MADFLTRLAQRTQQQTDVVRPVINPWTLLPVVKQATDNPAPSPVGGEESGFPAAGRTTSNVLATKETQPGNERPDLQEHHHPQPVVKAPEPRAPARSDEPASFPEDRPMAATDRWHTENGLTETRESAAVSTDGLILAGRPDSDGFSLTETDADRPISKPVAADMRGVDSSERLHQAPTVRSSAPVALPAAQDVVRDELRLVVESPAPDDVSSTKPPTTSSPQSSPTEFLDRASESPSPLSEALSRSESVEGLPVDIRAEVPQPEVSLPEPIVPDSPLDVRALSAPIAAPDLLDRQPQSADTPTVNVTIGRIDVRATPPASLPPARERPRPRPPAMSLSDYLKRRNGGSR